MNHNVTRRTFPLCSGHGPGTPGGLPAGTAGHAPALTNRTNAAYFFSHCRWWERAAGGSSSTRASSGCWRPGRHARNFATVAVHAPKQQRVRSSSSSGEGTAAAGQKPGSAGTAAGQRRHRSRAAQALRSGAGSATSAAPATVVQRRARGTALTGRTISHPGLNTQGASTKSTWESR